MGNVQHSSMADANLHVPGYVQGTDPGAVGAGKLWIDTSAGSTLWVAKIRNAADDGWEVVVRTAASQPEAEAGTDNAKYMTPLRTAQAIAELAPQAYTLSFDDADLTTGVLTVTHNLNSEYPVVAVYDNDKKVIIPDEITSTSVNSLTVDLSSYGTLTGTWNVTVK